MTQLKRVILSLFNCGVSASGHPATNGSPYFASGCPARLSLLFALQGSCFGLCGQSLDFAHTIWTSGQIRDLTHLPTIAGIVHKTRHCLLVQFAHNTTTSTATIKKKKKLHAHCSKSVVCLIIPLSFFSCFYSTMPTRQSAIIFKNLCHIFFLSSNYIIQDANK